jgi:L-amino acid N-acyltransferase YncA
MITVRIASPEDAKQISALLSANSGSQGGMLMGEWPIDVIESRICKGQSIIVAIDDDRRLLGVLLTQDKGFGAAPSVQAMLAAWHGDQNAYVYGPVCIAREARGHGVLERLYAGLRALRPNREAVLFIREDNRRSLQAHRRLGMREVARFELDGGNFIVLSDKA